MNYTKTYTKLFVASLAMLTTACSNPMFKQIGTSALGATGVVSGSQAESMFNAGEKLAKSQETLTPEQEYYLGRSVSAKILSKYRPYSNAAVTQYVNKVGYAVATVSDIPQTFGGYHFMVVDTDEINAMAAPGGFIFISRGFLKLLPTEDALAAVLAHEVAHVVLAHGVKAISNSALTDALAIGVKEGVTAAAGQNEVLGAATQLTGVFGESVGGVFDTLVDKGYSRKQEYQSDEYGAQLLARAGYNPAAMLTVLEVLEKAKKNAKGGGWLSTHPDPADRKSEVEGEIKATSDTAGEQARTARFKSTVGRS